MASEGSTSRVRRMATPRWTNDRWQSYAPREPPMSLENELGRADV
jgi:hypothetical protein